MLQERPLLEEACFKGGCILISQEGYSSRIKSRVESKSRIQLKPKAEGGEEPQARWHHRADVLFSSSVQERGEEAQPFGGGLTPPECHRQIGINRSTACKVRDTDLRASCEPLIEPQRQ